MSYLFKNNKTFNDEISKWMYQVTDMKYMFNNAKDFDHYIGDWDVSNVIYMRNMFNGAISFNQDISRWNVSKVINMKSTFEGAIKFNQDLSTKIISDDNNHYIAWNVYNVYEMSFMFQMHMILIKIYQIGVYLI